MGYILSLDQGTTGTTALLVEDNSLEIVAKTTHNFKQHYPEPGWVEHDLDDIWKSVEEAVCDIFKQFPRGRNALNSIGITNQRESVCSFDAKGKQLHRSIVWQDRRTGDLCTLKRDREPRIKELTGLTLDPYFSATKMAWLMEHCPRTRHALQKNELRIGTIDTYLIYKLTGGRGYYTEASNASRTLLMNIYTGFWDQELGDMFGIDTALLAEIKDSFGFFGKTQGNGILPDNIPINCVLGDQQSALIGQAGFHKGAVKCTYGTGSFVVMNIGRSPNLSQKGSLTTIAYRHKNQDCYALEGSCYIAGAAVGWLRDNLGLIETSAEVERLARCVGDLKETRHVLMLPFFTGIGSPYWKPNAKAALIGLTRDTGKPHIARAVLEGIALSVDDVLKSMEACTGAAFQELRVDGGASANDLLMEIQAALSGTKIIRPRIIETTAYGVALGTLVGRGERTFEEIARTWREEKVFEGYLEEAEYLRHKKNLWDEAIGRLYGDQKNHTI